MNLLVTLNSSLGADLGPNFNLTANVGSVGPSTATRSELLVGKSVTVSDTATQLTVTSTGTCTNSLNLLIGTPPNISLALSATCSDDPCFTAGTTSWPCSGRVAINLTNPPSPYTITISYYNTPSGGSSYATLVYVGGLPYVDLGFDSSGTQLGVTATLKNGAGTTVATSTVQIYSPNSTFNSGLPACPAPDA